MVAYTFGSGEIRDFSDTDEGFRNARDAGLKDGGTIGGQSMVDRKVRLTASVNYDGQFGVHCFSDGFSHKFRLNAMPTRHFLPNMGANVENDIPYGESGRIIIDVMVNDEAIEHLFPGSPFTLHDHPLIVTASGVVETIVENPVTPLRRPAWLD